MRYVVKKFMVYDGEAFYRGAAWTPKGFAVDKEIIRHFVTEEAEKADDVPAGPAAVKMEVAPGELPTEEQPPNDPMFAVPPLEKQPAPPPFVAPRKQRGRDATRSR